MREPQVYRDNNLRARPSHGVALIFIFVFLALQLNAQSGDVLHSIWYDDDRQLWVKVTNHSESGIVVQRITVEFTNSSKAIEQRQIRCQDKCRIDQEAEKDFGPLVIPK